MTPGQAKELLPVLRGYAEGRTVQWRYTMRRALPNNDWPWIDWDTRTNLTLLKLSDDQVGEAYEWRVKPTPREWAVCEGCNTLRSGTFKVCQKCGHSPLVKVREVMEGGL